MKKLVLLVIPFLLLGCTKTKKNEGKIINEVEIETQGGYVFKKIYVVDKKGITHEILTATSGNKLGGVSMLQLSVYREDD